MSRMFMSQQRYMAQTAAMLAMIADDPPNNVKGRGKKKRPGYIRGKLSERGYDLERLKGPQERKRWKAAVPAGKFRAYCQSCSLDIPGVGQTCRGTTPSGHVCMTKKVYT